MLLTENIDQVLDDGISRLREKKCLYALIDPVLENLLDQEGGSVSELFGGIQHFRLAISAFPQDKRPYLVFLGDERRQERQINFLLRRALEESWGFHDRESTRARTVCALFSAPGAMPARLAVCMGKAASIFAHGQVMTFRYWDPRISSQLPRLFGRQFWGQQLCHFGIESWWCYDFAESASVLIESRASDPQTDAKPEEGWLFDQDQLKKLEILSWANRISGLVAAWGVSPAPALSDLERIVFRAMHCGQQAEIDILRFAFATLTIHPAFDKHPAVAGTISHTSSFAAVMQGWTPDFVDDIKAGNWLVNEQISNRNKTMDDS